MNYLNINKEHYDSKYGDAPIQRTVDLVRNFETVLTDAQRTYTSWAGMYAGNFRHQLKDAIVLELGAGDGLNSLMMIALGAKHVTTIDISDESSLVVARAADELGYGQRITALSGDFAALGFEPDFFDLVVGKAFLHHLPHEIEDQYLCKTARILRPGGEARFFEPAINNAFLDSARWLVPLPDRPSRLNRAAFRAWQERDPHPLRDNSSAHYRRVGETYFGEVQIIPIGGLERFHRLIPAQHKRISHSFRRIAFKLERVLPYAIHLKIARSQTLILRLPKKTT